LPATALISNWRLTASALSSGLEMDFGNGQYRTNLAGNRRIVFGEPYRKRMHPSFINDDVKALGWPSSRALWELGLGAVRFSMEFQSGNRSPKWECCEKLE
jgi:hypothetical protein